MTKSGKIIPFNENSKKSFENKINDLAKRALRTLAICYKEDCGELSNY